MLGIFLDQETTGLDCYKHRLLEIALKIINLNTGDLLAKYESVLNQSEQVWDAKDPSSILVNGFLRKDIDKGKEEKQVAEDIKKIFAEVGISRYKAFFICQNPSFDRAFFAQLIDTYSQEKLFWPYHWLDLASMYFALQVQENKQQQKAIPLEMKVSKDKIAETYFLPPEEKPHRAMHGVDHLLLCYSRVVGFPLTANM